MSSHCQITVSLPFNYCLITIWLPFYFHLIIICLLSCPLTCQRNWGGLTISCGGNNRCWHDERGGEMLDSIWTWKRVFPQCLVSSLCLLCLSVSKSELKIYVTGQQMKGSEIHQDRTVLSVTHGILPRRTLTKPKQSSVAVTVFALFLPLKAWTSSSNGHCTEDGPFWGLMVLDFYICYCHCCGFSFFCVCVVYFFPVINPFHDAFCLI